MQQVLFDEKMDGITIDRIRREDGFSMPSKHLHDAYEIYYLLDGKRYYFIEKQTYEVTGGCLVFINRRQAHQTSQAGGGSHDRILIGLQEEPFSSFFCSTGELKLEDFLRSTGAFSGLPPRSAPSWRDCSCSWRMSCTKKPPATAWRRRPRWRGSFSSLREE